MELSTVVAGIKSVMICAAPGEERAGMCFFFIIDYSIWSFSMFSFFNMQFTDFQKKIQAIYISDINI